MTEMTCDGAGPAPQAAPANEAERAHPLRFHGSAGEYFRIWIVNLVLSLVTLGIYSAWATVRNRRYFYGNTDLDGHRFDFHGAPVAILKGRLLAAVVFLAYAFGSEFHWAITLGAFAVIAGGFPWILVQALRFRLANTSYRGLRFGFRGTSAAAYRRLGPLLFVGGALFAVYLWAILTIDMEDPEAVTRHLGLLLTVFGLTFLVNLVLLPVLWCRIRQFSMDHLVYGRHRAWTELRLGLFFKALGASLGLGLVATIAVGMGVAGLGEVIGLGPDRFLLFMVLFYALLVPAYLVPFAVWHCMTVNHVFSNTRLEGGLSFEMRLDAVFYWWILVSNAVAAVLTVGMAIPWAKVRMARYKLSCLEVRGDLDGFRGDARQDPAATGEELGEAFDLDFGF